MPPGSSPSRSILQMSSGEGQNVEPTRSTLPLETRQPGLSRSPLPPSTYASAGSGDSWKSPSSNSPEPAGQAGHFARASRIRLALCARTFASNDDAGEATQKIVSKAADTLIARFRVIDRTSRLTACRHEHKACSMPSRAWPCVMPQHHAPQNTHSTGTPKAAHAPDGERNVTLPPDTPRAEAEPKASSPARARCRRRAIARPSGRSQGRARCRRRTRPWRSVRTR
jgi:hypothetical protein